MISPEDTYPGRTVPASANYPEGAIKNETIPNSSDDGTPLDDLWGNDSEGLKQAIARSAGIVPTPPGNIPDTATASQILQGLIEMMQGRATNYDESGVANVYVLDVRANQQAPASLFNDQEFYFVAGNTNTIASTVDPVGLGAKNIVDTATAGTIVAGNRYGIRYRLGAGDFELISVSAGAIGSSEINKTELSTVVQTVHTSDGILATGVGIMVADNTVPQITEGDEYMTLVITPKSLTNILKIDVVINLGSSTPDPTMIAALFQDTTANALTAHIASNSQMDQASGTLSFSYFTVAGTVAARTYRVRAAGASGTTSFNGASGVQDLGGAGLSSITITEYLQ